MTASTRIWKELGLERTTDMAAIRKAYARRLKQTDVEADPAAFIALREALEAASSYARRQDRPSHTSERVHPDEPEAPRASGELSAPVLAASVAAQGLLSVPEREAEALDFRIAADAAPAVGEVPAPLVLPAPAAGFSPVWLDPREEGKGSVIAFAGRAPVDESMLREERFRRLQELLFGEDPPDPAEIGDLASAILADPEMTNLKYAASVEAWMAEMICASSPRSDPLIAAAVPCFRWDEDFGRLDQPVQVAAIMERWRGLLFLDHVSRPGHPFHKAWLELTRTDEESLDLNRWLMAGKVKSLLTVVREKYPAAESGLDGYRVALWEDRLYGEPEWLNAWGIGALLFFPPAAVFMAFIVRNPIWFRLAVIAWATLWSFGQLSR